MKFKFDPNQEHQLAAIDSVVDLFDGQPLVEFDIENIALSGSVAVSNRMEISPEDILENLKLIQDRNELEIDGALRMLDQNGVVGKNLSNGFMNFTVEMETGTGKTYVYLRTIFELNRLYGYRKFIIVVPSLAIREGVFKTLQITEEHFANLYDNPKLNYAIYDSGKLSLVRGFALSSGIEILLMTLASFNRDENIFLRVTDRFMGERPIDLVKATNPILILDEPQNMESENSREALALLDPIFTLRYSATHREKYNLTYQLTPVEAYEKGLVKRIEVAGVEQTSEAAQPLIRVESIKSDKETVSAKLTVRKLASSGSIQETVIKTNPGESLEELTNRSDYSGFVIDEINPGLNVIRFANGIELGEGEAIGIEREALWEGQIRYTIREHFLKQRRFRDKGIKVLSLFFIDRVDSYVHNDSPIRLIFENAFNEIKAEFDDWKDSDSSDVQGYYFASRRNREGDKIYEDSFSGNAQKDKEVYNLIMKEKERLLSFEEPISFIFSHSALREGWDNPNVFQICTLNESASEIRKRQEIGRGIRLAVNQDGQRLFEPQVNVLTVVANSSYEDYVRGLQSEYEEDYSRDETPPKPAKAKKKTASLRKEIMESEDFKKLWERIKHRTRYSIELDSEQLIQSVLDDLREIVIPSSAIVVTKGTVAIGDEGQFKALQISGAKTLIDLVGRHPLPNLISLIEEKLENTSPPVKISRITIFKICKHKETVEKALINPQAFASQVARSIRRNLADQVFDGIQYIKTGEWYEMSQFEGQYLANDEDLVKVDHSIYDYLRIDSAIEKTFATELEGQDRVKVFVKLPLWFKINTPIGDYNPDWAILIEKRDAHGEPTGEEEIRLVYETKGTNDKDALRVDEVRKIICGARHFKILDVNFDWGKTFTDMEKII